MKTFVRIWLGIGALAIVIGLCLVIVAFGNGASIHDLAAMDGVETTSLDESYSDVKALDFEIGYGNVKFEEGDGFHITAENIPVDSFKSYVEDGTWIFKEKYSSHFEIFGMRFSKEQLSHWDSDLTPKITITVPEGFSAENFSFDIGAGNVVADTIQTKDASFSVDAGKLEIDQLKVSGASDYHVGAGDMELNNVEADNISVDCGVGNVSVKGIVRGDSDVKVGVGRVELNLSGDDDDYTYQIDKGIGNVTINGENYHNSDRNRIGNDDAANSFSLNCGVGNITINFDNN